VISPAGRARCHRRRRNCFHQLDASLGRQDHTSLPYALMPFAIGTASVHRDPPHDRGDHDTPLWSGRDGCYVALIWPSDKAKYFLFRGLTFLPIIGSDLPRLRQPPSSEGGLRRDERLRRARPSSNFLVMRKKARTDRHQDRPLCPHRGSATVPPYNKRKRQWIWV